MWNVNSVNIVFIFNLPQFHNLAFFKYIHIASVGYFLIRSVDIALSIYIDNKYDRGVYMIKEKRRKERFIKRLLIGILVGMFGSWRAVRKHLKI